MTPQLDTKCLAEMTIDQTCQTDRFLVVVLVFGGFFCLFFVRLFVLFLHI